MKSIQEFKECIICEQEAYCMHVATTQISGGPEVKKYVCVACITSHMRLLNEYIAGK